MTISITMKPLDVKVNIEGYGVFSLRRPGAAQEIEMTEKLDNLQSEMKALTTKYKDFYEQEKALTAAGDKAGLEALFNSEEYAPVQAERKKIDDKTDAVLLESRKNFLSLWRSDDKEALERLMKEATYEQLQKAYAEAMEQADNA